MGVVVDNKLKFDKSNICHKVSALNRLKNILPLKTKASLNITQLFTLPYFNYCNQVWHHCRKRNIAKIEKVNERALRYIFKYKSASYHDLLHRIRLPSMETQRIQDILLTINKLLHIGQSSTHNIRDLITLRLSKYCIIFNMTISFLTES